MTYDPLLAVEATRVVLDTGALAAAATAVLVFGGTVWRWLIAPARRWLLDVHEVVTRELQPNSGTSMHDRLSRVETTLDDHVSNAQAHHVEQHLAARRRSTER